MRSNAQQYHAADPATLPGPALGSTLCATVLV
jgi:hypothetical protein